jgi:NAD(P)-dependent dehydrogenase (short-subunit alcohol dehydrogenase family)
MRVNRSSKAIVETPVYNTFLSDEEVKELLPTLDDFHPLGRNGRALDVTSAILFLAGDASASGRGSPGGAV